MIMTEFCIVEFKCNGISFYAIWCTDEDDYFLTSGGKLISFPGIDSAEKYLLGRPLVKPSFVSFDFDSLDYNNCDDYLGKWNIIDDLSKTLKIDFIGSHDEYTDLYAKFVYGSNLPALNDSGKQYVPVFAVEEQKQIEAVTKDMIKILKCALEIKG